jgi:hypothetical protein
VFLFTTILFSGSTVYFYSKFYLVFGDIVLFSQLKFICFLGNITGFLDFGLGSYRESESRIRL